MKPSCIFLVLAFFAVPLLRSGADDISAAREKFVTMVAELDGTHDNRLRALRAEYVDALLRVEAGLLAKGEERPLQELRKEKDRFARSRGWELERKDRIPVALQPTFDAFKGKAAEMEAKRRAARKRLDDFYRAYLEKHKRSLTQQNRIEEALKVKALQEGIDGYMPPTTGRPFLAEGQEPKPFKTRAELAEYLAGTRWALRWRGGPLPAKHGETVEFRVGQVLRVTNDDGSDEKVMYEIQDDLSIRVRDRYEKTLTFDPSFTMFSFDEPKRHRYRQGFLAGKPKEADSGEMWKDLLLYFPLDEVSETVRDLSPRGKHGKATMTAVVFYGRRDNAYLFNGKDSCIRVDNPVNLNDCEAVSLSVWVKMPGDLRDASVFSWGATEPYGGTHLTICKGRFRYRFGSGHNETGRELSESYTPDTWHHVVMTHDRSGGNVVYVDGKVIDSRPALALKGNDLLLTIGCRANKPPENKPYRGLIDEFMVFKRALSPSEVQSLYRCVGPPAPRDSGH